MMHSRLLFLQVDAQLEMVDANTNVTFIQYGDHFAPVNLDINLILIRRIALVGLLIVVECR